MNLLEKSPIHVNETRRFKHKLFVFNDLTRVDLIAQFSSIVRRLFILAILLSCILNFLYKIGNASLV